MEFPIFSGELIWDLEHAGVDSSGRFGPVPALTQWLEENHIGWTLKVTTTDYPEDTRNAVVHGRNSAYIYHIVIPDEEHAMHFKLRWR